jgi:hypothetical protein
MPFSINIFPSEQLVRVEAHGAINLRDCVETITNVIRHPDFNPQYRILADLRATKYEPSTMELHGLISVLSGNRAMYQNKIAVVIPDSMAQLARMVCRMAQTAGITIQPFTSTDSATQWLNDSH